MKILICDLKEQIKGDAEYLEKFMKNNVEIVEDYDEAVQKMKETNYDLLILEPCIIPPMVLHGDYEARLNRGLIFISKIKDTANPDIPVIALTAIHPSRFKKIKAINPKIEIIEKPGDLENLGSAVTKYAKVENKE
ncbi:MAG: hypothetical protein AB1333_01160 [Patescibacteria group bacterium]